MMARKNKLYANNSINLFFWEWVRLHTTIIYPFLVIKFWDFYFKRWAVFVLFCSLYVYVCTVCVSFGLFSILLLAFNGVHFFQLKNFFFRLLCLIARNFSRFRDLISWNHFLFVVEFSVIFCMMISFSHSAFQFSALCFFSLLCFVLFSVHFSDVLDTIRAHITKSSIPSYFCAAAFIVVYGLCPRNNSIPFVFFWFVRRVGGRMTKRSKERETNTRNINS